MKRAVALFGLVPVAVFFEASGVIRDALISVGVNAVSVDLRETERPGPHIVGNVFDWLDAGWAGAIMHPTCTYMCGSGLHWNARVPGREMVTLYWLQLVRRLMAAPIPRWAIENPRGAIGTAIRLKLRLREAERKISFARKSIENAGRKAWEFGL